VGDGDGNTIVVTDGVPIEVADNLRRVCVAVAGIVGSTTATRPEVRDEHAAVINKNNNPIINLVLLKLNEDGYLKSLPV
jgi:hypothetical protein